MPRGSNVSAVSSFVIGVSLTALGAMFGADALNSEVSRVAPIWRLAVATMFDARLSPGREMLTFALPRASVVQVDVFSYVAPSPKPVPSRVVFEYQSMSKVVLARLLIVPLMVVLVPL